MHQFKEGFLCQIASSLYEKYGQQIADLTFVFPNRRAGLFFTEYLNQIVSNPTFSPEIITIQELFSKLSPLRVDDELHLIFRLFRIYKELSGSSDSFDEFYLWGEMLLHDFDQVDKYLIDAELLFTNITDLKEIDAYFNDWNDERKEEIKHFWKSLTTGTQKGDQKEFSRLWQILFPLYQRFREELCLDNIAFEGMLFRDAVENNSLLSSSYLDQRNFIIAGFNALNACEKSLFKSLQSKQNITFYWDFDNYYLNDLHQEAGLFMRENLLNFPQQDIPYSINNFQKEKSIKVISTSSQIGQAQITANEIIKKKDSNLDFDETAVILCDEELLLPVLSSIPTQIETVNVTMGLPLKQTPLYGLINQLVSMQKGSNRNRDRSLFHYKNVIDILNNQLIKTIYPTECKDIVDNIIQNNLLYISNLELGTNKLFQKIFLINEIVSELPDYFLNILYDIFDFWDQNSGDLSSNYQEYIYLTYVSINKLNNVLFSEGFKIMGNKDFLSRETFFRLLIQYIGALSVSFEGEPLSGLQIMGILETRSLDFKNIILLSVNEGIMPKANTAGSFIPYHLRKGVGLPTVEEQNAMYAYYFYRLLQRAENVTFIYNSGSNGLKTGEKSRFLQQLLLESGMSIAESSLENIIDPLLVEPIIIKKNGDVLDHLNNILTTGKRISPTALDQYINCSLSYYFKYIARFEEEEEVSEEVDSKIFGKIFHGVMESLYSPWVGKTIEKDDLAKLIDNNQLITHHLLSAFAIHFFKTEINSGAPIISGRNTLVYEVIKKMVFQTLRLDLNKTPFDIVGLEMEVNANVLICSGAKSVRIGGYIDRIDSISGDIEIVDYKTGATDHSISSISDLFDPLLVKRNKAAFQTLVYAFIWDNNHHTEKNVYPAIYELKKIFSEQGSRLTFKETNNSDVNYHDVKNEFVPKLMKLVEEIFNPELSFVQTEVKEHCQYCSFTSLCARTTGQS